MKKPLSLGHNSMRNMSFHLLVFTIYVQYLVVNMWTAFSAAICLSLYGYIRGKLIDETDQMIQ